MLAQNASVVHDGNNGLLKKIVNQERLIDYLQQRIPELMDSAAVPGLAIALIEEGQILWQQGFGIKSTDAGQPVTEQTRFQAASLSKPIFAYAVMKLVEQGQLELDRPLINYVSEAYVRESFLQKPVDDQRFETITARMVLSHSTGFPNWRGDGELSIEFTPGSQFNYSGEGFVYLQRVVEHITGQSLNEFATRLVFEPLKMHASSYLWEESFDEPLASGHQSFGKVNEKRRMKEGNAAYSLYTTVEDYAKFMAALINRKDVSEKTVSQMLTPQGHVSDKDADTLQVLQSVAWGLGVGLQMTEDGTAFWHWGDNGSFKCLMIGYPGEKVGMVYFTNSANGLSIAKALVQNSLGGDCPALDWLNYDAYNSPTAVFIHTALNRGVKTAIEEFHAASKNNNETLLLDETRINQFGYHLMNNGKTDQARKIFRLNMEMHPRSGNVYDSYAEVHLVSGNQEVAAQYYQKSVELNPENEHGKRLLKQLLPGYKSQGNTTFVLERYADANLVTLAGSFNDWNPLHTLLHREGDRWVCRIDLEPRKYTYKFVVDGEWITDPDNPRTETDEAGHTNSVLNVQ